MIFFLATVLALVSLVGRRNVSLAYTGDDDFLDEKAAAFLELINDHREKNNLAPLVASHDLGAAAEHHSEDMAYQNSFSFSHTGKDNSSPRNRIVAHGYASDTWWSENVSAGRTNAHEAFDSWKASPGHHSNMVSLDCVAIGISMAFVPNAEFGFYWTTVFGGVADEAAKECDAEPAGGNNGDMGRNTAPDDEDPDDDGYSDGEEAFHMTGLIRTPSRPKTTRPA